jgi:UDP-2-acetamido-3-amino-2,3-dideoxy-glucuronate N-acetyltransferase
MNFFAHETAIIDEGCEIGNGTKIWHFSHVMPGCKIGENCNLGQNVVVSPKVILGNNVRVQNNVSIYEGVICEDDVFLGPSMVLTNVINPRSAVSRKSEYKTTLIKKGASIGANATIVCGNTIGEFAFVGAGAVVTKDVPAYALIVGNPAKQVGWMSEYGQKLIFDANNEATCNESNELYKIANGVVTKVNQ